VEEGAGVDVRLVADFISEGINVHHFPFVPEGLRKETVYEEGPRFIPYPTSYDLNDVLSSLCINPYPAFYLVGTYGYNLETADLVILLKNISALLQDRDRVLMFFDLIKSPSVIEKAYHDYEGVSTLFHKNVLARINQELNGNFDLRQFEYWPIYDAVTGVCCRYLVSTRSQSVILKNLDEQVNFKPWETIRLGTSQKYSEEMLQELLNVCGLAAERMLYDHRRFTCMTILRSIG
jgi:uncharacterized SAM-dependent methyltransferase